MMEYRRFAPGESFVSTAAYHADRERAPHLEQAPHRWRLETAVGMIDFYLKMGLHARPTTICDLGCGDGGLLSLLIPHRDAGEVVIYGVDFQPSNAAGWAERGIFGYQDNFITHLDTYVTDMTDLVVCTEVLEHLEDPHGLLRRIRAAGAAVVCSSPYVEGPGNIDASHNWAWDVTGYTAMLYDAGFESKRVLTDSHFQVHLALPRRVEAA